MGSRFSSSLTRKAPPVAMPAASMVGTPFIAPGADCMVKVPALVVPTFWKLIRYSSSQAFSLVRMTSSAMPFASAGPPHWQLVRATVLPLSLLAEKPPTTPVV